MQRRSTTPRPWSLYPAQNPDRFTNHKHGGSNEYFTFNTRDEHLSDLKLLYSGYLSQILKKNLYKKYKGTYFFVANVL